MFELDAFVEREAIMIPETAALDRAVRLRRNDERKDLATTPPGAACAIPSRWQLRQRRRRAGTPFPSPSSR